MAIQKQIKGLAAGLFSKISGPQLTILSFASMILMRSYIKVKNMVLDGGQTGRWQTLDKHLNSILLANYSTKIRNSPRQTTN